MTESIEDYVNAYLFHKNTATRDVVDVFGDNKRLKTAQHILEGAMLNFRVTKKEFLNLVAIEEEKRKKGVE